MDLDLRIITGKRVLTPFDTEEAEQFEGRFGYFSNYTDDFKHLETAAYGVLELTFGEYPYRFINDEDDCHGCLYFLPEEWVRKKVSRDIITDICRSTKHNLACLVGTQNTLLNSICDPKSGYKEAGDKSMVWHMRDIVKKAHDDFRALLNEFEKGNY